MTRKLWPIEAMLALVVVIAGAFLGLADIVAQRIVDFIL